MPKRKAEKAADNEAAAIEASSMRSPQKGSVVTANTPKQTE
jgi:hypothetical protein